MGKHLEYHGYPLHLWKSNKTFLESDNWLYGVSLMLIKKPIWSDNAKSMFINIGFSFEIILFVYQNVVYTVQSR